MVRIVIVLLLGVSRMLQAAACVPDSLPQRYPPRDEILQRGCSAFSLHEQMLCQEGARLFQDKTLSRDAAVNCVSCHPQKGAVVLSDGLPRPKVRGQNLKSPRTPSLLDAGRSTGPFFWNGRATRLEDQPYWPLYASQELDSSPHILQKHGGSSFVVQALAAYVRSLQSSPAPFDAWLRGDCQALQKDEIQGALLVLQQKSCTACHQGRELRGSEPVRLRYFAIPSALLEAEEAGYAADAGLSVFLPPNQERILQSLPQTLRNLSRRNRVFGRFGQDSSLRDFLIRHGQQPMDPILRSRLTNAELSAVLAFLEKSLLSRSIDIDDAFSAEVLALPP